MDIELCTVGGYNEVGKNMTALRVGDEAVILDMGIFLPNIVSFEEEGGHRRDLTAEELIKREIIPNDNYINKWKNLVKGIVISHCHLDHSAASVYLAPRYNAPIIGTPYTIEVIRNMLRDDELKIPNELKQLNSNSKIRVSKNIEIEFIHITHSTPQTVIVSVNTPKGSIVYTNDFKFDNSPTMGKKPNYERLKELGKEKVLAVIVDSLYSYHAKKTPSEKVAKEMLKEVMFGTENDENLIMATTFSSHIARLSTLLEFGKQLDREVLFFGRSMWKYINAAEKCGLIDFKSQSTIYAYKGQIQKKLKKIEKEGNRKDYLIVCTGGQGEPQSVLSKIAGGKFPFRFLKEDSVIFSNSVIPVDVNIKNRKEVEEKLMHKSV